MKAHLAKYNTLRNQILVVFLAVMTIVLSFVAIMTYHFGGTLIKDNAEIQLQQTAVQASGRMDTLYKQIDLLTTQAATNPAIQQLLYRLAEGEEATFQQRQSLLTIGNTFQAYSDGIQSFELYSAQNERLFPIDDTSLLDRVDWKWVEEAERAKGRQIWVGNDPDFPDSLLAIRRVSLVDRSFSSGGYLVVRIDPAYFSFSDGTNGNASEDYKILLDSNDQVITSNYDEPILPLLNQHSQTVQMNGQDYILVQETSAITGWRVAIATPVQALTAGTSILGTIIFISAALGLVIFSISSYLFSTVITNPIQKLTKTMKKAREGELYPITADPSTAEINELNLSYNQMVEHTNYLIRMVYEKELIRNQAELKALQAQINPHFLFNTLNALYWLLEDKEEEELADHVLAMSELFRYTISGPKKDEWVTLKTELDHVERYMQLMKMRVGKRLEWNISLPKSYESVKIPKLIIQPIVENAIMHGIENKPGKGHVTITVVPSMRSSSLILSVEDDGPGMPKHVLRAIQNSMETEGISSVKGNGVAVANVHKRLKLHFEGHENNGLEIKSEMGKGTSVSFELPYFTGMRKFYEQ
ncbi:sensor histidine kinase [Jeotgalibacillus proteolyticus]|uniref:histidine kinase n=1 Tax=Jeotgalibacillus proteolyticus TaxID=2082395 RepID=A0A2S5GBE3_9BACL|nr:sensor histidine kinase [Jeotgalibacillus proteolyticus]PPA70235.1 sensor histidine kinase [Jeotgalibacillus proteolyticus]